MANYIEQYDSAKSDPQFINSFKVKPREAEEIIISNISCIYGQDDSFSILDLGCGDGTFAKHLRSRFPRAEIHAWDPCDRLIRRSQAQESKDNIRYEIFNSFSSDSQLLKDYHHQFDVITVVAVTQVLSGNGGNEPQKPSSILEGIYQFMECVNNLLKPKDSMFINFDGYHDFPEYKLISHEWTVDLDFVEASLDPKTRINSCVYNYPSKKWLTSKLVNLGFKSIKMDSFHLANAKIRYANEPGSSYTSEIGGLTESMLGVVIQPWTHVVCRK